jgi:hypothetical protein
MAKVPSERWPTGAALVDAARAALGDEAARIRARRRHRWLGMTAAVAGVAVAALAILTLGGGGTALARSDSLVRIDRGGELIGGLAVPMQPTAVTVCGGSVWVTTRTGTVFQIDPTSLTPHEVRVQGTPSDVANVGDLAAVVSGPPERVTIVDAAFGRDVWVANPNGRRLDLLSPPYTAVATSVSVPGAPRLVAAGEGAVWAVGGRTLWRMDPRALRVVATVRLPFAPVAIDAGRGGVWLADASADAVLRIDAATGRPAQTIQVGDAPTAIAVGADGVWIANRMDGTVSRIDPRRNAVLETIRVGGRPIDLVAGLGAVWIVRARTAEAA